MYWPVLRAKPSYLVRRALNLQLSPRWPPFATTTHSGRLDNIKKISTSASQAVSPPSSRPKSAGGKVPEIVLSDNQPAELPERLSRLSAWTLTTSGMGITRQFTFPTFAAAWRFMSLVADECKAQRHHPVWSNLYNEVTVEWTTHKPKGLSIKDVEMAEFCDRTAEEMGLKAQNGSPTSSEHLQQCDRQRAAEATMQSSAYSINFSTPVSSADAEVGATRRIQRYVGTKPTMLIHTDLSSWLAVVLSCNLRWSLFLGIILLEIRRAVDARTRQRREIAVVSRFACVSQCCAAVTARGSYLVTSSNQVSRTLGQ